jgi:hypothetical protein
MPKDQKAAYLRSKGWVHTSGTRYRNRDGVEGSFASAVAYQVRADMETT